MTILTYSPFSCYTTRSKHASAHTDVLSAGRLCVDGSQLQSMENEMVKAIQGALFKAQRRRVEETCKGDRYTISIT